MNHIRRIVLACERDMEVVDCWAVGASKAMFEYQKSSKMTWGIEVDNFMYALEKKDFHMFFIVFFGFVAV